ncbi:MAG: aminopeptidase P family protein [Bacteroidota bacterium]
MTPTEYLQTIRNHMYTQQIDAYIIPSSDPHQSEYLADYWKARAQFSGFTGSAGTLIITQNHAGLWTDSRYFLQAEEELKDGPITLHRQQIPHAPEHIDWLCTHLQQQSAEKKKRSKVGINGWLFSVGQRQFLQKKLATANIDLLTDIDLIDVAWPNRPALPQNPVFRLDLKYTGVTSSEKLAQIRAGMESLGANAYLVSTLDDIAWTLNLRGSDIHANPVFVSYLFIEKDSATLFIDTKKITLPLQKELVQEGIQLLAYDELPGFLARPYATTKVLLPISTTSWNAYKLIHPDQVVRGKNLIAELKAVKNETEVAQIKKAMQKDGVALTRLFRWMEQTLSQRAIPEAEIATQLASFRKAQGHYFGESFDAIVGYQGNGAIIHYRPEAGKCANVEQEGILLLDSGGQYLEGTTDITRTIALSPPSAEQKTAYTAVLKGHVELASIQFPAGTTGVQLDTLARMHLWNAGLNYGHGTGHGVGAFLNVHEGPQGFTANPKNSRASVPFQAGMLTSNEPGFYKTNAFGIRIENLILCQPAATAGFLRFETLSLFPIDIQLIDWEMITEAEKTWLNEYHARVLLELSPLLNEEEQAWLAEKCRAIQ